MKDTITFRQAASANLDEIMGIIDEAKAFLKEQGVDQWQRGYPNRQQLAKDIDNGNAYLLANSDGTIVATMAILFGTEPDYIEIHQGEWGRQPPYAAIHRIALSATLRGSGLGNFMLAEAANLCKSKGVSSLRVDTHRHNQPMQKFLKKNGFIERGIIYLTGNTTEAGQERIAFDRAL